MMIKFNRKNLEMMQFNEKNKKIITHKININ